MARSNCGPETPMSILTMLPERSTVVACFRNGRFRRDQISFNIIADLLDM